MDLDDPFIESFLQRSRTRKENLNKRRIGISFVNKKRAPLVDEQQINPAKEPPPVQNIIPVSEQECTNTNADPAELPFAAKKFLLEKALLIGTLKMDEEMIDYTLCVAQSAAVFENPLKANTGPKKFSNFRKPKRINIPNFSNFESNNRDCQITKSPVKSVQVVSEKSPITMTQQNSTKSSIKMTQQNSARSAIKMTQQNSAKSPIKVIQLNSVECLCKISQQNHQSVALSPVKTCQSVLTKSPAKSSIQPQQTTGSSAKKLFSTPVSSIPSTNKKSSGSKLQTKEMSVKVGKERKREICYLVKNWEKLSSSLSVENNLKMENNIDPEHAFSESDAVHRASDYDEESNSDNEAGHEYDEAGHEYDEDEHKVENQNVKECSDDESDVGESVFDSQDSEIASLMPMVPNYSNESNIWPREDTQSISSKNSRSAASSQGDSGVSSYSDNSCYNASRSQHCTSDSSARSCDVRNSDAMERTPSSFKENNCDIPLLSTVDFCRKQKQVTRLTPPVRTIVWHKNVLSPDSPDDDYTETIQKHIKLKIKKSKKRTLLIDDHQQFVMNFPSRLQISESKCHQVSVKNLQKEILLQQSIINETSKALNYCSASAEFSVSTEQVEAEKHLLIATQKCKFYLNEISRLKTCGGSQGKNVIDSEGTLLISDIELPLKKEFMASVLEGRRTDTVHYFLCLIHHGAQVIVTQMMSTDEVSDGVLRFTNAKRITLKNLPAYFSVVFEVYALQTKKEVLSHEKKYHIKKEYSKIRLMPKLKKLVRKILMPAISSPGDPNAIRSTSFGIVGFTRFTLQNCNIKIFALEKVPFTSPLDGVLRVQLKLHVEHHKIRGFLTMFEVVNGFGSLQRRWCVLDAHYLAYWKYPEDEKKNSDGVIDLKQCVTGEVKLCSRDVCARPHTFKLVTVSRQAKGDKNTTISSSYNTIMETEHLLTADTKEEGIHWCKKLNEALTHCRKWNPQALCPVESMQD